MVRSSRSLVLGDRLRRVAKAAVPLGLQRPVRDLWARAQPASRRAWTYLPDGWPDDPGTGWQGQAVADAYRLKWPAFRATLQGSGPFGVIHEVPLGTGMRADDAGAELLGTTFGYVLARAAGGAKRLRVLDWGGAVGHHALLAMLSFPDLDFQYHVKELPAVCRVGRELMPEVVFHETDDCLTQSYDLVFASGALECARDWKVLLSSLAGAADPYLFVTRTPVAARSASFVGLQRVSAYGYGSSIPFWVIARDELMNVAATSSLSLVREFVTSEECDIPGAPERNVPCPGLLFETGGHV